MPAGQSAGAKRLTHSICRRALRALAFATILSAFAPVAFADDAGPNEDLQGVIRRQLDDFAKDDADDAFAQAAPNIQEKFRDAKTFLSMVKTAYPPVYRHHSVQFGEASRNGDEAHQSVTFVDVDNQVWNAVYLLNKQVDGKWRIVGCAVAQSDDTSL